MEEEEEEEVFEIRYPVDGAVSMGADPFLRRERRSDGFSGEAVDIGEVVRVGGGGVGVLIVRQKEVADAEAEFSKTGDAASSECSDAWLVSFKGSQLEEGNEGDGVDLDREHVAGASVLNSVEDKVSARGDGVDGRVCTGRRVDDAETDSKELTGTELYWVGEGTEAG